MTKVLKHYKNGELVYPNPTKDGLQLWYDVAGKRNTDFNKEVLEDLSGNGNDGVLQNFNFTEESGYNKNKLLFDGVDDQLQIPDLQLSENAMSVQVGDKVYVYEDDKVLTVGEDGSVEVEGRNYLLNSNVEKTNPREYLRYADLSSIFDKYGTGTYTFSFDLKAEVAGDIQVYAVDGTNIRYIYPSKVIKVTTEYERYSMTVEVTLNREDDTRTSLSFFGTYDTGRIPSVKNVKIEKGNKATPWSPAPEDYKTTILSPSTLDKLQLYNRPLVKDEMLQNAESEGLKELKEGQVVQDGLLLHYDFSKETNESAYKDKAFDYSGNGNHGTLRNFNYTAESGYVGDGLKFDGADDYVIYNDSTISAYTLETIALIREPGGETYAPLVSTHSHISGNRFGIVLMSYGKHYRVIYADATGNKTVTKTNVFNYHQKYHLAATITGNIITLYIDGEVVNTEEINGFISSQNGEHTGLYLGRWNSYGSYRPQGVIHSVRAYNRPLTPEEVAHNYTIEKERFGISEELPIGKATIGKTLKVGGVK